MPAFLFDLDGTLVDSVYQHIDAWREAFTNEGFAVPLWRLHRRIGMPGDLFVRALDRELRLDIDKERRQRLEAAHDAAFLARMAQVRALPGASDLLETLHRLDLPVAIVTSSGRDSAQPLVDKLGLTFGIELVTKEETHAHKPDPGAFISGAKKLGSQPQETLVFGDSEWDMLAAQRASYLGVGFLTGGYGTEELQQAGAFRVYAGPHEAVTRLEEIGVDEGGAEG